MAEIDHADGELLGDLFKGTDGRLSQAPFDLAEKTFGKICLFREPFEGELTFAPFIPNRIPEIFHADGLTLNPYCVN